MPATLESARRYQDVIAVPDPHKQFAFDTIFDQSSFFARQRSRWKFRLLQRLAPKLRRILGPEEKVRYVTRGMRFSFLETYFGGILIGFLNRRAIVVTNQRIILFQLHNRGKPGDLLEQVRYACVKRVKRTLLGNTHVQFANDSRMTLARVPRADRNFLARLIEYTRAQGASESGGIEKLCCYCYQVVRGHPGSCPHCHGRFVSPRVASTLSLLFPGIGDFYLGHHAFAAIEIAAAAIAWFSAYWQVMVEQRPPEVVGLFLLGMHVADSRLTRHIAGMGLAPAVRPKLSVGESLVKFASVVLVFLSAIVGAVLYQTRLEYKRVTAVETARVEHITVATLGERLAARDSTWSVVVLYATYSPQARYMFPQLANLYHEYSRRGVAFKIFSVDKQTVAEVPTFLEQNGLHSLKPVRILPWRTGDLATVMAPFGFAVSARWDIPLVALQDSTARVIWQAQGIANLGDLAAILRQAAN